MLYSQTITDERIRIFTIAVKDSIKNGYIVNTRHTSLISDAMALDYIIF